MPGRADSGGFSNSLSSFAAISEKADPSNIPTIIDVRIYSFIPLVVFPTPDFAIAGYHV